MSCSAWTVWWRWLWMEAAKVSIRYQSQKFTSDKTNREIPRATIFFSQVWLRADIWRAEQCTLDAESWLIDKLLRRCHQCPFKSRRHAPVESMRARTLFYAEEKRPERHDDVVRYSSMCILAIGAAKRAVLTLPWGERWRSGQNHRKAADGMAKRQGEMNEQRTLNWMPINWKHLRFEG